MSRWFFFIVGLANLGLGIYCLGWTNAIATGIGVFLIGASGVVRNGALIAALWDRDSIESKP